jgi:hypothetical protein
MFALSLQADIPIIGGIASEVYVDKAATWLPVVPDKRAKRAPIRDPYAAADVARARWQTALLLPEPPVAMGPCFRRDDSPQSSSDRLAEADRAVGLPNTLRQPALRLAFCRCMQAMIRPRSGISDEHSRITSPVQSRCASASLAAWLGAGAIAIQKTAAERILRARIESR